MSKHNLWLGGWYNYALSLSGPSACVVPARLLYDCCHVTNSYVFRFPLIPPASGQRLNFIIKFCSVLFCSAWNHVFINVATHVSNGVITRNVNFNM